LGAQGGGGNQQHRQHGHENAGPAQGGLTACEEGKGHDLSLELNGPLDLRTAADLSPNNQGFAMAVSLTILNILVT
jgi:hypothetical protein